MSSKKELRRLLSSTLQKRQKEASSSTISKVDHPYAKYDDNNNLICIVCSTQIKNSTSWNTHLLSAGHKENLKRLKEAKKKFTEPSIQIRDKSKISLSSDENKKTNTKSESILSPENNKKRSIGTEEDDGDVKEFVDYDSDEKDGKDEQVSLRVKRVKFDIDEMESQVSTSSALFFDDNSKMDEDHEGFPDEASSSRVEVQEPISNQSDVDADRTQAKDPVETSDQALPADFFDSPSKTSSHKSTIATQQETTTEIDEQEWLQFQKIISKETQVSDQIAFAEEEELQRDRDEMLEREQEMCFQRSERLKDAVRRVKESKERMMVDVVEKKSTEGQLSEDDDEQDDDDDDDDDFENGWMDWRAQRIT